MILLMAICVDLAYALIGVLVASLVTKPEDKLSLMDILTWPLIICFFIIMALVTAVRNLYIRIKNMKG